MRHLAMVPPVVVVVAVALTLVIVHKEAAGMVGVEVCLSRVGDGVVVFLYCGGVGTTMNCVADCCGGGGVGSYVVVTSLRVFCCGDAGGGDDADVLRWCDVCHLYCHHVHEYARWVLSFFVSGKNP